MLRDNYDSKLDGKNLSSHKFSFVFCHHTFVPVRSSSALITRLFLNVRLLLVSERIGSERINERKSGKKRDVSCLRCHVYQSVHGQTASLCCFQVIHKAPFKEEITLMSLHKSIDVN